MNQTSNIEKARTCEGCFYFADLYTGGGRCMALPQPSPTSKGRTECSLFQDIPQKIDDTVRATMYPTIVAGIGRSRMDLSGGRPERREMECECGELVTSEGTDFECRECKRTWKVVAR